MRFAVGIALLLLIQGCAERVQKANNQSQSEMVQPAVQTKPGTQGFQPVKEMLSGNCSPCHVQGGKMYERLPFDNPETVRTHSDRILGRLKNPEDQKILEDWLSEPQL